MWIRQPGIIFLHTVMQVGTHLDHSISTYFVSQSGAFMLIKGPKCKYKFIVSDKIVSFKLQNGVVNIMSIMHCKLLQQKKN